ncbi:MAG: ribonuclease Z [Lautropia sp.]|nr:ribonuclease Z [Lautropia sp.]
MLKLTFLGTSAGVPTRNRFMSALAVQSPLTGRGWYLLDCAEGTQHRLLRTPLSLHDLAGVCISHVHGDHCYGLPGLLATAGLQGRKHPLQLIAPAPIWEWVRSTQRLTDLYVPFAIEFVDIETLQNISMPLAVGRDARLSVGSHPLRHRVPSHAFRFELQQRLVQLDDEALRQRGLPPGPGWGRLKQGADVVLGGQTLHSRDYVQVRNRRLAAVMGGDNGEPALLRDACRDAQLLVHEATYTQAVQDRIGAERLHSSAQEVAVFAQQAGLPNLILTHLSPRHHPAAELARMRQEVTAHYGGRAFLAQDFDVFTLDFDGHLAASDGRHDGIGRSTHRMSSKECVREYVESHGEGDIAGHAQPSNSIPVAFANATNSRS